ncbi:MAG TPA: FecR domain-containing protein [Patescibacteria group bacterium]|nr:FecR domain-containing protein [Patescibacteria group bacterium]
MMTRCFYRIFTLAWLLFPALAQAEAIGTVVEVEGQASIARGSAAGMPVKIEDTVELGDLITTGPKSRLFILLADNTEWTLSENTKFRVDEYVFNPDDNTDNKARYSALEGGFHYISGLVAKKANPDVTITSVAGTIGIRGTDLMVAPDADGSVDVYVQEGAVDVSGGGATARLAQGQGTLVQRRGAAPLRPDAWKKERLPRMLGVLTLARQAEMPARIAKMQPRQVAMREKFRARAAERLQQRRGGEPGKRQQKIDQWRDKFKGGREQRLEQREEKFEKRGERRGMLDERQQKIEQLRQQYAGGGQAATPAAAAGKEAIGQRAGKMEERRETMQQQVEERKAAIADRKEQLQERRAEIGEKRAEIKDAVADKKEQLQDRRERLRAHRDKKDGDAAEADDTPEKRRWRALQNRQK